MAFVLDSSVALAWLLPDEGSKRTDALADRYEHEDGFVPPVWPLEVGNAMLMALRRKRISKSEFNRFVSALSESPIEVDAGAPLADVLALAQQCELSSYDAAYLELAQRRKLPLATLDARLRTACRKLRIPVVP